MKSHKRLSELLIETGAYKDLDSPVILTSGELGIYYINTEKLCQDNGEFEKYGDDSRAMIQHAVKMTKEHPAFKEAIDIITDNINTQTSGKGAFLISGGQRRDWLFSGPVAAKLGVPHVSLYKQIKRQQDKTELVYPQIDSVGGFNSLNGWQIIHIADLLTEASSCYRKEDAIDMGWIPMIRNQQGTISKLVSIVTRLQGGEERLNEIGVEPFSFVAIDQDFIKEHSKYSFRNIAYMANPKLWSEGYLEANGALALIKTFDPAGGKIDRAKKFLDRYGDFLAKTNKWNELDTEVNKKYNIHLGQITGDVD